MKVFIMTDLEGVAGVLNRQDFVLWDSRYYEKAKDLLTLEVNAAVEGFSEAGATEILVADGHGAGAIQPELLDERAMLIRGFPDPYPFGLTADFDVAATVGQHAKAGTPYAHICHTGSQHVIDFTVNGISIGEFGQMALCAGELGIPMIFGAGDYAFCREAEELAPGIETVAVKRGLVPGTGDECTFEEYRNRNHAAIHVSPAKSRNMIKEGAFKALKRFTADRSGFTVLRFTPPYEAVIKYRPGEGRSARTAVKRHDSSVIAALNRPE